VGINLKGQTMTEKNAYGVAEFCRRNSIGITKFYEEVRAGRLIGRKVGTKTIVMAADEAAWLASLSPLSTRRAK
jgi:hypothetical protein